MPVRFSCMSGMPVRHETPWQTQVRSNVIYDVIYGAYRKAMITVVFYLLVGVIAFGILLQLLHDEISAIGSFLRDVFTGGLSLGGNRFSS